MDVNFNPDLVFDSDPKHTSDSDSVFRLVFDPGPVLSFGRSSAFHYDPGPVLDSALRPAFNFDSAIIHSSDLNEAGDCRTKNGIYLERDGVRNQKQDRDLNKECDKLALRAEPGLEC
ncbi:hypothetical protein EVAR_4121_1 [Eumeta japonica]|uniref:Uncharacterized protein n=1 Tax=Eumeta variegata TaxID=151549 RepID=A0A4C1T446_EUMVA|nr:hypothetical protein EVAR_4121_1 [Eumeta japonica]